MLNYIVYILLNIQIVFNIILLVSNVILLVSNVILLSVFIKLKNFVKIKIVKIDVKFMVKCINIVLSFPQTYYIILT